MGFFSDLLGGGGSHSQTTQSTSNVTNTQLAGGNIAGPAVYGTGNSVILNTTDSGAIAGGLGLASAGVQSATDISAAALALGGSATAAGDTVAIAGLSHAQDAYTSSLALVGDVTSNALNNDYGLSSQALTLAGGTNTFAAGTVDQVTTFAGRALDSVNRFASSALDAGNYIAGKSLDSQSAAFSDSLATVSNANSKALGAIEDNANSSTAAIAAAYKQAFTTTVDSQNQAIAGVQNLAAQVSQSSQQVTDTTVQKIIWALVIGAVAIVVIGKGGLK